MGIGSFCFFFSFSMLLTSGSVVHKCFGKGSTLQVNQVLTSGSLAQKWFDTWFRVRNFANETDSNPSREKVNQNET